MTFMPGMLLPCSSEDLLEKKMPDTTFDFNFLAAMMDKPNLVRAVLYVHLQVFCRLQVAVSSSEARAGTPRQHLFLGCHAPWEDHLHGPPRAEHS